MEKVYFMKRFSTFQIHWLGLVCFVPLFLFCFHEQANGQSNCPNSNFNLGNFNNWDGRYGSFSVPAANVGFVTSGNNPRHMIIPTPGSTDPHTCGGLITSLPGEANVARLGNDNTGAEAEQLRYTLTVSPNNNLFIYKYAVVLQDPGHNPADQPSFTIEVVDQNGVMFDPVCGYYYVFSQPGLPGWNSCSESTVVWKDWTTVGLDLSSLLGQTITIIFTTRDCALGGHYGYAYISTSCAKLEMTVGYCPQSSTATLTAPPGFSYLWDGGATTQSIVITNPVQGTVYNCVLTAVNGCQVTIHATIQPTQIIPDFSATQPCKGIATTFADGSTINQNSIVNWKWDFGDATGVNGVQNPSHLYNSCGIFNVKLIAYSSDGCSDTIIKPVTVNCRPNPGLTGLDTLCAGTSGVQYFTDPAYSTYTWTVSAGGSLTAGNTPPTDSAVVTWNSPGLQNICVNYTNSFGCNALPPKCINVMVNPIPVPNITGPDPRCAGDYGLYTTQPGMNSYNWTVSAGGHDSIGGGTSNNTITIVWDSPGNQFVKVGYTSAEGCPSNGQTIKSITVNPLPVPALNGPDSTCINSAGQVFSTDPGQSNYVWNHPGGTVVAGGSPLDNTITLTWNSTGIKIVCVNYTQNNCTAIAPTCHAVLVNPRPVPTITGNINPPFGSTTQYTTQSGMSNYSWTVTGGSFMSPVNGNVVSVKWTSSGNQYITVNYTNSHGCPGMSPDTLHLFVLPYPAIFNVTGGGPFCEADSGVYIGLSNSEVGVYYQLKRYGADYGSPVNGSGTGFNFPIVNQPGTYTVFAANIITGLSKWMNGQVIVTKNPLPTVFLLTPPGDTCAGTNLCLNGSQAGIIYSLFYNLNDSLLSVMGTGQQGYLCFGPQTLPGTYRCRAEDTVTHCKAWMDGVVNLHPSPTIFNVIPAGILCEGDSLRLGGSQIGIKYMLLLNNMYIGMVVYGTGDTISFGTLPWPGYYTVIAIDTLTLCNSFMNGGGTLYAKPTPYAITPQPSGHYCPPADLGLNDSDPSVTYKLVWNNVDTVSIKQGTGSVFQFTPAQTRYGYYRVWARNDSTHCGRWMMDTIWVDSIPQSYNLVPTGPLCFGDSTIHLSGSRLGVQYQFVNTSIPEVDTTLTGTGGALFFGKPKHTGVYMVQAVDMAHPPTNCAAWMNGSAIISPLPLTFMISPSGVQCAGTLIQLLGSEAGVSYTICRINGGVVTEGITQAGGGILNFGPQTIPGTYKIRGTYIASPNCYRWMGDSTEIVAFPGQYTVTASGTCSPVRICLSGSQPGMHYQLIQNPNTNSEILIGNLTGTGGSICFDSVRNAGFFGVRAGYGGSPTCPVWMIGFITVRATPHIYAIFPSGVHCAEEVEIKLLGSQGPSYRYILTLGGVDWDTLSGVNGPLSFGIQASPGVYRVRVDTSNLHCSVYMNDSVVLNPKPIPYSMSPSDSICPGTYPLMLNASQSGIKYILINRTTGLPMGYAVGAGGPVNFGLQYIPGIYRVMAIDTTRSTNCWRWMNDSTKITPLPTVFSIYPAGKQCAGTVISLLGTQPNAQYQLWRHTGSMNNQVGSLPGLAGGGQISFGQQVTSGVYTIKAILSNYPNCDTLMDDSVTIISLPTAYNVHITHPPCIPATISLLTSQTGVSYRLVMITPAFTIFPSSVPGGGVVSFGPLFNAGTYTIVGEYPATPHCQRWMNDTVQIKTIPTIYSIFPRGDTCSGAEIHLNGSQSGLEYILMLNNSIPIKQLTGNNGDLNFGKQYSEGIYKITTDTAYCSVRMADSLYIHPRPVAYNLMPGGPNCDSTKIELFHSVAGINYELRKNGIPTVVLPGNDTILSFGYQHGGIYTVRGFDPVSGCDSLMNGIVTITALPAVNVGPDTSICPGYSISLLAQATSFNPSTIVWSANGPGTFSPVNTLATTFTPVQTSGSIILTATVHGISPQCTPQWKSDSMVLSIVPFPVVDAGIDTTICASMTSFPLNPSVTGYHTFSWVASSGGTFNPPNASNTTYSISNTDRNNGSVILTINASGLTLCPDHVTPDSRLVTIDSLPVAFAGNDTTVCASDSVHLVNSATTHSVNPSWTILMGSGTFSPNPPNVLHPTYFPSNADKTNGFVKLILTVHGTAACLSAQHTDTIKININPLPVVVAGANASICIADTFQCNPQVQHISTVLWQGGDGTFIPNDQTLLARYHPGANDSIAGCIILRLTVGGTLTCISQTAKDSLQLCFDPYPIVNAGVNDTICHGDSVLLAGDTIHASGVYWLSAQGSLGGYFSPSNTVINPIYHPSTVENSIGKAVLILKAFGRLTCLGKTPNDTVEIAIRNLPTAALSGGTTLCEGETDTISILLTGAPPWTLSYFAGITPHVLSGIYASPCKIAVSPTVTTVYTLFGVSDKYCTGNIFTGSALFTVHPKPSAYPMLTPFGTNFCEGSQGVLIKLISSQTGVKYELKLFNTTVGTPLMGNNGSMLNFGYQSTPGIYKVWASQAWPSGDTCHNWMQDSVIVSVTQPPLVNFFADPSCLGDSTHFHLSGGSEILRVSTWTWDFSDGPPKTYNFPYEPSHLYATYGNYNVTLTVVDTTGVCTKVLIHQVAVATLPVVAFYTDPYSPNCENETIHFFDASTNAGNNNNVTWTWDYGDGSPTVTITWPNSPNVSHNYAGPGTYSAILTVTNNHGCSNSDTVPVVVHPAPVPNFDFVPSPGCVNEAVHFFDLSQSNGSGGIVSHSWKFDDPASGANNTSGLLNPDHTFGQSGTYDSVMLIISASNGCRDTIYKPITIQLEPDAAFTATTVCLNEITQFASTSVSNATAINSYKWYFGDGTHLFGLYPAASHTYLASGQYQVSLKVTNSNGCSDSVSAFVNVHPLPFAAFTFTPGNCVGDSVAFVNVSTTPQSYIVKWTWSFGDPGNPVTITFPANPNIKHKYLTPGTYNVTLTVQTADSCKDSQTNQVVVVDNPLANFTWSTVHCVHSPIQFTDLSQPVGSLPIAVWNWNFGDPASGASNTNTAQNPFHVFNVPGTYTVRLIINNINGCDDTVSYPVHIDSIPKASFHADTVCKGLRTTFTDLSSANSGSITSWTWNFGDGTPPLVILPPAQGDTSHLYTSPGSFTVTLLVANSHGCLKDTSMEVSVNPHPTALFSHSDSTCKWEHIQFTDLSYTTGGMINQWLWNFGDGLTGTIKNPVHVYSSPGNFLVVLKVWNTFSCVDSVKIPITIHTPPTARFDYYNNFCNPGIVAFHDSSSAVNQSIISWHWTFTQGQSSTLQNPVFTFPVSDSANSYLVCLVVTDGNGCKDTICDSVVVKPKMNLTILADTACFRDQTHLQAIPATGDYLKNFHWNFDDSSGPDPNTSTLPNPTHTFSEVRTYTVTLSASNSDNCPLSNYRQVSLHSLPTPDFSYDPIPYCDSAKVVFRYSAAGIGSKVDSIRWRFGPGVTDTTQKVPLPGIMRKHLPFGTRNVTMTAYNSSGCRDSVTKPVTVSCLAAIFGIDTLHCAQQSVKFYDSSAPAAAIKRWYWYFGDGGDTTYIKRPVAIHHTYKDTGTYLVNLVVITIIGSDTIYDSIKKEIFVRPTPSADFIVSKTCIPDSTSFTIFTDSTDMHIIAYTWLFGDKYAPGKDTSSLNNPKYRFKRKGSYNPSLTVKNASGCKFNVKHKVNVYTPPVASISVPQPICETEQFQLSDSSMYGDIKKINKWHWEINNSVIFDIENPFYKFLTSGDYPVTLLVTDTAGCHDDTVNVIHVNPTPVSSFDVGYNYQGKQGQLLLNNLSTGATTYVWEFGNGKSSTEKNPVALFTDDGSYIIKLVSINQFDCMDTTFLKYDLRFKGLYVPNAFAPSSINLGIRLFQPVGVNLVTYHVTVFDNWGHLMWESAKLDEKGIPTEGWDGTFEGQEMPQGNYVWKISASFVDGSQWQGSDNGAVGGGKTKGTVILIR